MAAGGSASVEPLSLAAFAATLAAVNAAPGPVTAIILARVMGRDTRGGAAFAFGVACADIAALVLVWTGLALSAQSHPEALAVLRWLGAGYLLWLARGMWRSAAATDLGAQPGPGRVLPGVLAGTATCLCNPHTLLFFLALLPGLVPLDRLDGAGLVMLLAVSAAVNGAMFGALICLGARMRALIRAPGPARLLNRGLALATGGAALWLAAA